MFFLFVQIYLVYDNIFLKWCLFGFIWCETVHFLNVFFICAGKSLPGGLPVGGKAHWGGLMSNRRYQNPGSAKKNQLPPPTQIMAYFVIDDKICVNATGDNQQEACKSPDFRINYHFGGIFY